MFKFMMANIDGDGFHLYLANTNYMSASFATNYPDTDWTATNYRYGLFNVYYEN